MGEIERERAKVAAGRRAAGRSRQTRLGKVTELAVVARKVIEKAAAKEKAKQQLAEEEKAKQAKEVLIISDSD